MDFQRALPYELWELIIRELPRSDQRTCLLVSRITHDVALPLIFSRLMIFFGKWEFATDPTDLGYTTWSHRDVDAARHNWTSMDLLRHITRTPEFADLVREVTVAAYSIGNFIEVSACLVDALRKLHNLKTFRYYGTRPSINSEMIEALSDGSGQNLQELRLPLPVNSRLYRQAGSGRSYGFTVPGGSPIAPSSWHVCFKKLHIHTVKIPQSPKIKVSSEDIGDSRSMVEAITDTLRHLSVPHLGWCLSVGDLQTTDLAWSRLCDLQTLELTNMSRHPRTDALQVSRLFDHCPSLCSLTILSARAEDIDAFSVSPKALDRLESLKLSFDPRDAGWVDWEVDIAPFLLEKKHLRRLDIMLPRDSESPADVLQILTTIPTVEVLGLPLYAPRVWSAETMKKLDDNLPPNLSVLLVSGARLHAETEKWTELLKKRRTLRYVHFVYPQTSATELESTLDFTENLLRDPPMSLELVGDGPRLRWVDRSVKPVPVYSRSWPLSTIWFRSAADFGSADGRADKFGEDSEWILRYHDVELFDGHDPSGFGPFLTDPTAK